MLNSPQTVTELLTTLKELQQSLNGAVLLTELLKAKYSKDMSNYSHLGSYSEMQWDKNKVVVYFENYDVYLTQTWQSDSHCGIHSISNPKQVFASQQTSTVYVN